MSAIDYETGIASSPSDLLAKIATFAAANGWTANTPASGRVLVKNNVLVGLNTSVSGSLNYLGARGAITYAAGNAWDAQTDNAGATVLMGGFSAGPYTAYHFFTGAEDGHDYLHIALEISAGIYRHMSLGELVKYGSYTGGTYADGTNWSASNSFRNQPQSSSSATIADANNNFSGAHVRADFDGKVNNWQFINTSTTAGTHGVGSSRSNGLAQMFPSRGYQQWNLRSPLAPLTYYLNRASALRSPAGRIPDMRSVGMQNLAPGETLTIGGESWMCFPIIQRTEVFNVTPSSVDSSGYMGYAYLLP